MKSSDLEEKYQLKSPNISIKIPGGKSTVIHCRMKKGFTEDQVLLLFEPNINHLQGIKMSEQVYILLG